MQSIRNKINELEAILTESSVDFLCVSEHFLKFDEMESLNICDYKVSSSYCRKVSRGGGTLILTKPFLECRSMEKINSLSIEKQCEICCVFVPKQNLYIICVYRSPTVILSASEDYGLFLSILEQSLNSLPTANIILTGDFNTSFGSDSRECASLIDLLSTYNFKQMITSNTRQNKCIDNIFINFTSNICSSLSIDLGISDHYGQFLNFQLGKMQKISKLRKICRPITAQGKQIFFNNVENINWDFIDDANMNCNKKFELFTEEIKNAMINAFPEKSVLYDPNANYDSNWFNQNLREMRSKLMLLSDLYKQYKSDYLKRELSDYKTKYKNAIINAKKSKNEDLIKNSQNSIKTMWQIINKKRNNTHSHIQKDISLTPNHFSTYFSEVAGNLLEDLGDSEIDPIDKMHNVELYHPNLFNFKLVTHNNVREAIDSIKNKNSKDIFGLNIILVKSIKNFIISPLCKLINLCIKEACFPDCLKEAIVIPIYKKGDANEAKNYRPVSLLPIFAKIVEKCFAWQIANYFENNNIFYKKQFGFRKSKNTTSAVLNLVEQALEAFEDREHMCTIFCDLSKAFDCVSHEILLEKLNRYKFCHNSVTLLRSYLTNRYQTIKINNKYSNKTKIIHGVPQGSVLGPLLFLIYVNDFPNSNEHSSDILFADDTSISVQNKNIEQLSATVCEVESRAEQWFKANKLTLNRDKTVHMIFSLRDKSGHNVPDPQDSTKFLGVYVDDKLTWHVHIDNLSKKLSKNTFILRNLANEVGKEALKNAYFALCHSLLSYAILVWGQASNWPRIFALQRRAIRIISGLNYRDDCREQFRKLKIQTLPSIYIYELLLYARKSLYAQDVNRVREYHYNTRQKALLITPYVRLTKSQKGIQVLAPKFYSKLPPDIKSLPDLDFKKKIRTILLGKTFYSYDEYLSYNFNM